MVRRLMKGGHRCVVHDLSAENIKRLTKDGAVGAATLDQLVQEAENGRGNDLADGCRPAAVDATLARPHPASSRPATSSSTAAIPTISDDIRRAKKSWAHKRGSIMPTLAPAAEFGAWERGYCLMIGGEAATIRHLDPIFRTLAPGRGKIPAHARPGKGVKGTAEL